MTKLGQRETWNKKRTAALSALLLGCVFTPAIAFAQTQPNPPAQTSVEDGDEVVVTGTRASRRAAIERKRDLSVIADVVASDLIGKLPDYNTAEALQRLPGVSVEIDQGEPRYVVIRGIDPNLNQVTIDGNIVGAPEAEGRRVSLDTIPSDLVAAIEVIKAVTPDYDANAVGGNINIVTPTAFDRPDAFTSVTARGAYAEKADKFGYGGSAMHGRTFGANEQFGMVVGGSYFKRFIDSDNAQPRNWTDLPGGLSTPTSYRLYDYSIMRERIGGIFNLNYRPNDDLNVYVRSIYNEFTDEEERDQVDYAFARGTPSFPSANQISFDSGRSTREFRRNNQTQKLYNIAPGLEYRVGDVQLDLEYTYARAEEVTPLRDDIEFRSGSIFNSTLDLGASRPLFAVLDTGIYDPENFPLRRIRQRSEDITEDLHALKADVTFDLDGGVESFVKFGAKYTQRQKNRDNRQIQREPTGAVTLGATGAVRAELENFYEGDYRYGPTIDDRAVLAFFDANPALIEVDQDQTLINDFASDYAIDESIYAGYGMASVSVGDLRAIIGARVEVTDAIFNAFAIRDSNASGSFEPDDIQPLQFDNRYTDFLPSLHLDYRPTDQLVMRAAWTNTIGRPNFSDNVPTFEEEDNVGQAGNPDLQPFRSRGLDASVEYYPDADSLFSVGVFHKTIENPIFTRTIFNTAFAGVPLLALAQPQNATSGDLFGIEVNAVRRLTFLPGLLDGFGVSANATWVDSSVDVPNREGEDLPFFRQSDWLANAALFYEKGPLEARVAVSYRDDFIVSVGDSMASDIYDKNRTAIDARVSYRVWEGIEVFASLANIGDAPLTFFQTDESQTFAREIYSYSADFGISASF